MAKIKNAPNSDRRKILKQSGLIASGSLLGAVSPGLLLADTAQAAITPACGDTAPTASQGAGPFYTADSPLRADLRDPNMQGIPMQLSGRVMNQYCESIANAVLDFWHADDAGVYDNQGYRLRGHLFTDNDGYYSLTTIVPGLYPGRTRHIHVIVQGAQTRPLTTQLYFPAEPSNPGDFGYDLRLELKPMGSRNAFEFDFILAG